MTKALQDTSSTTPLPVGVELVKPSFWDVLRYLPLYMLSLVPLRLLYGLSDMLHFILYHWVRYRRDVVAENLALSFPEKGASEIKMIERKFYRHFCDLAVESVKILTLPMRKGIRRLRVKNPEILRKYYEQKRNVIFYMGHYGNWEWFTFLPKMIPHQLTSFYQPLSNKYVDKLMKITRCRFDAYVIASHRGYKSILGLHRQNMLTATMIIGDQRPRPSSPKHWTSFLHRETAFLTGADRIAMKSNTVVLFPAFSKPKRGVYEVEFLLIEDNPVDAAAGTIIDTYATILERTIRQAPEMWLWSHKRWKLSREPEQKL
jgi:KDO2-lipid IV(A) lauroyltransferase